MNDKEVKKGVLEYYDRLFTAFEIYDPRLSAYYCRMIDIMTNEYEKKSKENVLVLKREKSEQS